MLNKLRGFQFVITLALKFKNKIHEDEAKYSNFYSKLKAESIIHNTGIDNMLKTIYSTIMKKIWKYYSEGSGWTIDSVIEQNIDISRYKLLSGSNYIKFPKELNHSRKGLINTQNTDNNKCLKWQISHPVDKNSPTIRKNHNDFARELYFKDTKFPIKIRDIQKIGNKNCISICVFGYENREKKLPIYVSESSSERHIGVLLIKKSNLTIFLSKILT